jgi:cell division protein FtsX
MARILILAVLAVMLLGGVLAADQALQNPDVAVDTGTETQQDEFAEVGVSVLDAAPLALFALVAGVVIAAIGRVG